MSAIKKGTILMPDHPSDDATFNMSINLYPIATRVCYVVVTMLISIDRVPILAARKTKSPAKRSFRYSRKTSAGHSCPTALPFPEVINVLPDFWWLTVSRVFLSRKCSDLIPQQTLGMKRSPLCMLTVHRSISIPHSVIILFHTVLFYCSPTMQGSW